MMRVKIDMDISSSAAEVINITSRSVNGLRSRVRIYTSRCINNIWIRPPFLNCLWNSRRRHSRCCWFKTYYLTIARAWF